MDIDSYLRFVFALVFVLALIGLFAVLARRMGLGYRTAGRIGKARRLSIEETIPVDSKRRLVLVRRDDKEHLLLIGGGNDVVVESGLGLADSSRNASPDFQRELRKAAQTTRMEPVLGDGDMGAGGAKDK